MGSKRKGNRKQKKIKEWVSLPEQDENFAFIAGYTSGGAPYGITWEEWEQMEKMDQMEEKTANSEKKQWFELEELPFD